MKKIFILCISLFSLNSIAEEYTIDTKGAHAFIQFRVQHLGYSWLYGRFNEFSGRFSYHELNPEKNEISIKVNTNSVDSNHAERDKHLRSEKFLNTNTHPTAHFVSTKYTPLTKNTATVTGTLTLNGVSQNITIHTTHIGGGNDPWGGVRQGFEGKTTLKASDFNLDLAKKLGPASANIEMILSVEGIRQ